MSDAIDQMSHEEFIIYLAIPGVFTDEEIAGKILNYYACSTSLQRLELAQALRDRNGPGELRGPIRTVIRSLNNLPAIEGD